MGYILLSSVYYGLARLNPNPSEPDRCSPLFGGSVYGRRREGFTIDVPQNEKQFGNLEFCLVGHFFTDRSIRVLIMKDRLAEIWRPGKGVFIKKLEGGVFLF